MRPLRAWLVRLTSLFRSNSREREMADEFEANLQLHIDDNIRAGMTPEEARRLAVVKFGPVEAIKEEWRDRAGFRLVELLRQDGRYAVRRLRRQPGFAFLVILTVAIGVGANAAMFGFVEALVLRTPPHVENSDRLVEVERVGSYPRFRELSSRLQSVAMTATTYPRRQPVSVGAKAHPIATQCVTSGYFDVLRVPLASGRAFTTSDEQGNGPRVLVLSHATWMKAFGSDAGAIGRDITLAGERFTIVGVAPRGFNGLGPERAEAWTPIAASPQMCSGSPDPGILQVTAAGWLTVVGKLRDGTDLEQARAELAVLEADQEPFVTMDGEVIETSAILSLLYPVRRPALTAEGRLALWLSGGAGLLLLLTCANVTGLLSVRTLDRQREIAIRLQLGASRRRVATQLLVEHLLIALLGGGAALLLASWLHTALANYFTFIVEPELLNWHMLGLMLGGAAVVGLASGLLPSLRATHPAMNTHLRTGQGVVGRTTRRASGALAVQIALALVLITGAGLFVRSVDRYRSDFAYDIQRVVVAAADLESASVSTGEASATFARMLDAVQRLPVVESAAIVVGSVGFGGPSSMTFLSASPAWGDEPFEVLEASDGYFSALGLRITSGRGFTADDRKRASPPMVLNTLLAKKLFEDRDPVGRCVYMGRTCHEVIGISEPYRASRGGPLPADPQAVMLLSDTRPPERAPQTLVIRTQGPAADHVATITTALLRTASGVPLIDVQPMSDLVDLQATSWRLGADVFSLFGLLAVGLASIGIYGTLVFLIRRRTVEIGVRLALGARRQDIAAMVLRYGSAVGAAGLTLGLAGAVAGSRYMESLLFNVAALDGWTLAVACIVVTLAVLGGCLVPALRAARIDPATALRYD